MISEQIECLVCSKETEKFIEEYVKARYETVLKATLDEAMLRKAKKQAYTAVDSK
jgi:hypothetical protein